MSLTTKDQLNMVIKTFKKLLSFKVDKTELATKIDRSELEEEVSKHLVNSDWNAPEGESGHIKNRPFYSEGQTVEAQVSTLTNTRIYGSNGNSVLYKTEVPIASMDYVYGEEYTISIGDKVYNMNLTYQYDNGIGGYSVGFNLKQGVEILNFIKFDSAYPFCLAFADRLWSVPTNGQIISGELHCYLPSDSVLPISVKISSAETIKKIDPKFLPDGVMIVSVTTTDNTYTPDKTYAEIKAAVDKGQLVRLFDVSEMRYADLVFISSAVARFASVVHKNSGLTYTEWDMYSYMTGLYKTTKSMGENVDLSGYAKTEDIPEKLPNPHALTFTGAVNATYDGSEAVSVEIPQGGGESKKWVHIAQIDIAEDTNKIYITEDVEGKPFEVENIHAFFKAVKRTDEISAVRVMKLIYYDGEISDYQSQMNGPLIQQNNFGDKNRDKYYYYESVVVGNYRKQNAVESLASFDSAINASAPSVYEDGTTIGTIKMNATIDGIVLTAVNGFKAGDTIDIWGI